MLSSTDDCTAIDHVTIYKYTMASSKSVEDAEWSGELFNCVFRNVTDAHDCADLGKTVCMAQSLAYNLHFVSNKITYAGDKDIAYWDDIAIKLHGKMDHFNAFMDYRMVFYTPDLTVFLTERVQAHTPMLLRTSEDKSTGDTWYHALLSSPSGKIFEIVSTRVNMKKLSDVETFKAFLARNGGSIPSWAAETGSCAHTQSVNSPYSVDELDAWYEQFNAAAGSRNPMPIRNQIAVTSLAKTKSFYNDVFPSIQMKHQDANTDTCSSISLNLESYTAQGYRIETRFVQNDEVERGSTSLREFVQYIQETHDTYTEPNKGWDAWYDRHLGFMCNKCPLDKYMSKLNKKGISFMPHGRDSTTENTGAPTQHVWTAGAESYGLELQGSIDFSFRPCYSVFDWCTWDTVGAKFCSSDVDAESTSL